MKFKDKEHQIFYESTIAKYKMVHGSIDCYSMPLFYLLGLCRDTRNHFNSLFDLKEHGIILSGIHSSWQTGTSFKICRLAFNLWNGFCSEENEETNEMEFCRDFVVDEIFCCEYAEYFFEAIRLRYPEYCHC